MQSLSLSFIKRSLSNLPKLKSQQRVRKSKKIKKIRMSLLSSLLNSLSVQCHNNLSHSNILNSKGSKITININKCLSSIINRINLININSNMELNIIRNTSLKCQQSTVTQIPETTWSNLTNTSSSNGTRLINNILNTNNI